MNNRKATGSEEIPAKIIKILFINDKDYFVNSFNFIIKVKQIPKS